MYMKNMKDTNCIDIVRIQKLKKRLNTGRNKAQ